MVLDAVVVRVLSRSGRDRLIRSLRERPWRSAADLADELEADFDPVADELERLQDLEVVKRDGQDPAKWALIDAREPVLYRHERPRPLSESALDLLAIVAADPWQTASTYTQAKGGYRNGCYSQLETLTDRGLLQLTTKDGVKHWGPLDRTPPEGHMRMRAGAKSLKRQALRERILVLLDRHPWQTRRRIGELLKAQPKSVGTRLRAMLDQDEVVRQRTKGASAPWVYAYALPASRPIVDADRQRIVEEQHDRAPERYGKTKNRVSRLLKRRPWLTARQISDDLGLKTSQAQGALASLREADEVQRVADGAYRYALPDAELTRNVTGELRHGGGRTALKRAVDVLRDGGGLTANELRERIHDETGRRYNGLRQQLNAACDRGELTRTDGRRGRSKVVEYSLPDPDVVVVPAADLAGEITAAAAKLRDQGWDVHVELEPPTEAESP